MNLTELNFFLNELFTFPPFRETERGDFVFYADRLVSLLLCAKNYS